MTPTSKREEFEYSKVYFQIRAIIMSLVLVFAILLFGREAGNVLAPFLLLIMMLMLVLIVFGISPTFTNHWMTRTRLILRRGLYFKAIIPFSNVAVLEEYDGEARLGLTLSRSSSILFVTSSKHNLVEVKLRKPKRFPQMLGFSAKRIVFNIDRRDDFLSSAKEKLKLLSPVKANGPDS